MVLLNKFRNLGIRTKLILIFSSFSILIIFATGFTSYQLAKDALKEQSFRQLTSIRETKKRTIQNYFSQIKNQIITLSQNSMTIESMKVFNEEFKALDTAYSSSEISLFQESILGYYNNQFIPRLEENLERKVDPEKLLPSSNAALALQHYYISANKHPLGSKNDLIQASDSSEYSSQHLKVHPVFDSFLKKFGYYDIFLVSNDGDIVYSVFKEVDYGTNLISGPYSNTNFSRVFKKARNSEEAGSNFIHDFELYKPSYNAPASFIASPIFEDGKRIGVLIFQMPVDNINSIMTGDQNWEKDGLGESGETYLVGGDQKMRSISRFLIQDEEQYIEALKSSGVGAEDLSNIKHFETSILFQPVSTSASRNAISGLSGNEIITDYRGVKVLSSYAPAEIEGLNWAILSEIDEDEAFMPIYHLRNLITGIGIGLILIAALVASLFAKSFTQPILKLKSLINELAKGKLPEKVESKRSDEIGETNQAINVLVDGLRNASDFAHGIGEGKFDHDFNPASDEDNLGNALCQMRDRLADIASEESKRSWSIRGQARFGDILRNNSEDTETLSYTLVSNLVEYLEANQGGLFIIENDSDNHEEHYLELKGAYAYGRKKFLNKQIIKNEGLIGQCWVEGETILLTEVPDDYINIGSGLGEAKPTCVLIVPLKINEEILGVLELASFKVLEEHEIKLVEKIAESIASTFKSVKTNERTVQLLQESESQSKELQQQEEEMRQNMEEMQATQEAFNRKEKEYLDEIESLKQELNKEQEMSR